MKTSNSSSIKLEGISTEKFYFDPKKPDFIKQSYKYPEFDLKKFGNLRENLLIYIIVLYDKHSPIREDKDMPFMQKKREAAEMAGLMRNGKIKDEIANVLLGENDEFNKALAKYLTFQHSILLTRIAVLELVQEKAILNAMKMGDNKAIQLSLQTTEELEKALNEASGGNEWHKIKEAIQTEAGKHTDGLRVEDMVEKAQDGKLESPYPNDYKPEDIKYLSHQKPEE